MVKNRDDKTDKKNLNLTLFTKVLSRAQCLVLNKVGWRWLKRRAYFCDVLRAYALKKTEQICSRFYSSVFEGIKTEQSALFLKTAVATTVEYSWSRTSFWTAVRWKGHMYQKTEQPKTELKTERTKWVLDPKCPFANLLANGLLAKWGLHMP